MDPVRTLFAPAAGPALRPWRVTRVQTAAAAGQELPAELLAQIQVCQNAADLADRPGDPPASRAELRSLLAPPYRGRRFVHLAHDHYGRLLGYARLGVYSAFHHQLAHGALTVHPAARRHGVGGTLLGALAACAKANGRGRLVLDGPRNAATDGFARSWGLHVGGCDLRSRLDLNSVALHAKLATTLPAQRHAPDGHLLPMRWAGASPRIPARRADRNPRHPARRPGRPGRHTVHRGRGTPPRTRRVDGRAARVHGRPHCAPAGRVLAQPGRPRGAFAVAYLGLGERCDARVGRVGVQGVEGFDQRVEQVFGARAGPAHREQVAVRGVPLGRERGGQLRVQRHRVQVEPGAQVAAADVQAPAAREAVGRRVARAVEHEPPAAAVRHWRRAASAPSSVPPTPRRRRRPGCTVSAPCASWWWNAL